MARLSDGSLPAICHLITYDGPTLDDTTDTTDQG
jgi:hypothetical protein